MPLADILLITTVLLTLAMAVAGWGSRSPLPFSVLLVLLGVLVDLFSPYFTFAEQISQFHITPDVVFYLFLPALIFEAALSLDARALLNNIAPVLVLAIPGMLVSAFLVAAGLRLSLETDFTAALLFGALISATDPVAVIALFKELGAPRRLTVLVEGESLLNDATAIVLFHILLAVIVTNDFSLFSSGDAALEFIRVFCGGIVTGSVLGMLTGELMVKLRSDNSGIPVVLSLAAAYAGFIIAEHHFRVSGIMSVLATAISMNIFGMNRLPQHEASTVHNTWGFIVLICNSLLFILIGLSVDLFTLFGYWMPILAAGGAVYLARAVSVYVFIPLTTRCFSLPAISLGDRLIMWWGGLKGGLAIAIVMSIPDSLPERQLLIELTLGVVLVSLLLSGSTVRPLIRRLQIDALTEEERTELEQNMDDVKTSVNAVLHSFYNLHLMDKEVQNSLKQRLAETLGNDPAGLSQQQLLNHIHLLALGAEADELEYLYEIGLVNNYVYLTFKDIIRRDRELNFTDLENATQDVSMQNSFLRLENLLIDFLVKVNWLHGILVRYQNMRFANQIRHDLAGVLMAHNALKAIKNCEQQYPIDEKKLEVIKTVYKLRLFRRQSKLKSFSDAYPEYFQQYQYIVFLQAALRHSMQLLAKESAAGKINQKVYLRILKRLQTTQRQLPILKTSLSLYKRYTWLDLVPLFSGLPKALLNQLAKDCHYVNLLPGDTVFHENHRGHSLYILVNGKMNVFRKNGQGVDVHLAELREGSFIGVHALLKEKSVYSETVKAKTYVTLLKMTVEVVLKAARETPELQKRLRQADLTL